jgi:hypothetical protein
MVLRRRVGRVAADLSGITTYLVLSTVPHQVIGEPTTPGHDGASETIPMA